MSNLRYGDTGEEVKKVQEALGIKADGIWGKETEAAVRNFQSQNNLAVDGIVGVNTSAALFNNKTENTDSGPVSGNVTIGAEPGTEEAATGPGGGPARWAWETEGSGSPNAKNKVRDPFEMSSATKGYYSQLKEYDDSRPGEYQSQYGDQINSILQTILNANSFDYNTDPTYNALYDQYKAIYEANGQKAMKDAMGTAAGLTGGYGSSYAQSVGQQAYNDYMSQLNDKNIDLINLARNMYDSDLALKRQNLSDLLALDDQDYARYSDEYNKWLTDRNYVADMYSQSLANDINMYQYGQNFDYNAAQDALNYEYQTSKDADAQYDDAYSMAYSLAMAGIPVSERYSSILNEDDIATLNSIASGGTFTSRGSLSGSSSDSSSDSSSGKSSGSTTGKSNASEGNSKGATDSKNSAGYTEAEDFLKRNSLWSHNGIDSKLNEYVSAGKITKEEADALKQKYPGTDYDKNEFVEYIKNQLPDSVNFNNPESDVKKITDFANKMVKEKKVSEENANNALKILGIIDGEYQPQKYVLIDSFGRPVGEYTESNLEYMVRNGEVLKQSDGKGNYTYISRW